MTAWYALAKISDFWLIYTRAEIGGKDVDLYLTPGPGWNWASNPQDARRFQYSYEALTHAFDECPLRLYRSELDDGYIEINFEMKDCIIQRGTGRARLTLDTVWLIRDLAIPQPRRTTLPQPKLLTKETSNAN